MTLCVCAFHPYHHCRSLNLRISVSLLKLNPEGMNHVQTKSTVKKTWRFSTGKGKVCHWVQSGTSTNCFSFLLPPSVNSPRFNIILPSASWLCRWMFYKKLFNANMPILRAVSVHIILFVRPYNQILFYFTVPAKLSELDKWRPSW